MKVLAGDIGGTKTLLHIAEVRGTHIKSLHQARFASQDYSDFETLLSEFLQQAPANLRNTITAACFGVAGPVNEPEQGARTARITNLPWIMDESNLVQVLGMPRVRLINDFYATASGIEALDEEDFAVIHDAPTINAAPRLVVGAGTGLGVAQLMWCEQRYHAYSSEGGHIHFAPTNALQSELLSFMHQHHDRVSYERLVSGKGLLAMYQFLHQRDGGDVARLNNILEHADPPSAITDSARSGSDPIAKAAMNLFMSIYGAVVGDLALITLAYGGIYVAGGIAPKLLDELRQGPFMEAYSQKGRMSGLVMKMQVSVVLNQDIGLCGSTLVASRL